MVHPDCPPGSVGACNRVAAAKGRPKHHKLPIRCAVFNRLYSFCCAGLCPRASASPPPPPPLPPHSMRQNPVWSERHSLNSNLPRPGTVAISAHTEPQCYIDMRTASQTCIRRRSSRRLRAILHGRHASMNTAYCGFSNTVMLVRPDRKHPSESLMDLRCQWLSAHGSRRRRDTTAAVH